MIYGDQQLGTLSDGDSYCVEWRSCVNSLCGSTNAPLAPPPLLPAAIPTPLPVVFPITLPVAPRTRLVPCFRRQEEPAAGGTDEVTVGCTYSPH